QPGRPAKLAPPPTGGGPMKLIAIGIDTPDQSQFIFDTLREAVEHERVVLEDGSYAGAEGIVHLKGRTQRMFGDQIDEALRSALLLRALIFALGHLEAVAAAA